VDGGNFEGYIKIATPIGAIIDYFFSDLALKNRVRSRDSTS
jgi:hypothetical protein